MSRRLGAAHDARLTHREGREVVVVQVALRVLRFERVDALVLARRPEGEQGQRLRLAAREEAAAVRARQDAHLGADRAGSRRDRARRGALLDGDAAADDVLLELREGAPRLDQPDRVAQLLAVARGERLDDLLAHLDGRVCRPFLSVTAVTRSTSAPKRASICLVVTRSMLLGHLPLGLARLATELVLHVDELDDLDLRETQRLDDLGFGDFTGARLDHLEGVAVAAHDEVERAVPRGRGSG